MGMDLKEDPFTLGVFQRVSNLKICHIRVKNIKSSPRITFEVTHLKGEAYRTTIHNSC